MLKTPKTRSMVWIGVVAMALGLALTGCKKKAEEAPPATKEPVKEPVKEPAKEPPPAIDAAPAPATITVAPEIQAVIDAADRSADDKALDAGRKPGELLTFAGIKPGMKVAEIMAGGGYTSELLARVVGPEGKVYGQNTPAILKNFAEKPWAARLATPVMKNVVRVDRELDDPLPPEAKDLDAVVMHLIYHDTVWLKVDRAKMNKAIFAALKPGGIYLVVDHSAKAGAGINDAETLHRIEEPVVAREVTEAGFVLDREGDFLHNPADARDWNSSPKAAAEKRGTSDRFVLVFRKP